MPKCLRSGDQLLTQLTGRKIKIKSDILNSEQKINRNRLSLQFDVGGIGSITRQCPWTNSVPGPT